MFKPFKPPLLKSTVQPVAIDLTEDQIESQPPPYKKQRLIHVVEDSRPKKVVAPASAGVIAPRKPLTVVNNPTESKQSSSCLSEGPEGYYMVLWQVESYKFSKDEC